MQPARAHLHRDVETIAAALRAGQVIALPTETLIGLSCRADDERARARIAALKGIEAPRGFVVLVHEAEVLDPLVAPECDRRALDFLRSVWPAPLSAIVPLASPVPWGSERDGVCTVAVRVPADATLRRILCAVGGPVLSTSANRTGEAPCRDAAEVVSTFGSGLDLVVESDATGSGLPSTLVDATRWPLQVVREGAFDVRRVLEGVVP